jgi:hypothetical protein
MCASLIYSIDVMVLGIVRDEEADSEAVNNILIEIRKLAFKWKGHTQLGM